MDVDYLIRGIYADRIISPFIQLGAIEAYESHFKVKYPSLSRQINKQAPKNLCISCLKKCDKPCHTINIKNLSYIRKRKTQTGTAKGNTYLNKKSPKGVSIEALLNAMDGLKLGWKQEKNIKEQFKDLQPELLTLFTGMAINTFDEARTEDIDEIMIRGLYALLPDREKDFVNTREPPKYKSKIDIKDYISFWNSANQMKNIKTAFKDIRLPSHYRWSGRIKELDPNTQSRALIPFRAVGAIPFPCERDKDWHEHVRYIDTGDLGFKWIDDGWVGSDKTMKKRIDISTGLNRDEIISRENKETTVLNWDELFDKYHK